MATIASRAERKKKFIISIVLCVLLAAAICITLFSFIQNRSSLFKDQSFARVVAEALDKKPSEITKEDLEAIKVLGIITAEDTETSDTEDTKTTVTIGYDELATLLETDTTVEDFDTSTYSENYNKSVKSADLTFELTTLDDLALFPNLTLIDVQEQKLLKNLKAIKTMTNLKHLSIGGTSVKDISAIAELTNIEYLNIQSLGIDDISVLENLTKLKSLYMSENNITDISAISGLVNLETLVLDNNYSTVAIETSDTSVADTSDDTSTVTEKIVPISLDPIKGLTALKTLSLGSMGLTDISAVSELVNLEGFYAPSNEIVDVSALEKLTKLETLDLSKNKISDISAMADLVKLTQLSLTNNEIEDISAIEKSVEIEYLYLTDNKIVDVSPIKDMTKMAYLYLSNNAIEDVSSLTNFQDGTLIVAYLTGNPVTNGATLKEKYTKAYIMYDEPEESETSGDTLADTSGTASDTSDVTSDTSTVESTADTSTTESAVESTVSEE
ncbi:MAG: hypothetical protein A2Y17_11820 [Clostridiales bacterium GWF2_38_85]|nr:MAG: hypothetical protein A2Y17_11820 [Clostridiales bacterium GWF2_38_85]